MSRHRFVPRLDRAEDRLAPAVFTPGVVTAPSDFFGGTSLLIDFDRDTTGAAIPADTPISNQYAALGVGFTLKNRSDFPATSTRSIVDAISTPNSLYVRQGERGVGVRTVVTFDPAVRNPLPTAVGFVFTDGPPGGFTAQAFDAAGKLVDEATIDTATTSFVPQAGDTEDTFIGLRSAGGITRIEFASARSNNAGVVGYEVDNLRFNTPGQPLPPPPPGPGTGNPAPGVRPPDLAIASAGSTAQVFRVGANDQLTAAAGAANPFGLPGVVRASSGDVNGDGATDTVYVTGPGTGTRQFIKVVSGRDGSDLLAGGVFEPFAAAEPVTNLGLFVAVADVTADGKAEVIVAPDQGGGPRVQIFSLDGSTLTRVANFFAIDPAFFGGSRIATGNLDGDEFADLIWVAGTGGGPRVAVFNGATLVGNRGGPQRFFGDFFIFEPALRDGVYVAAGDLDGDGQDELVFGGGPGGGPRVQVVRFAALARDVVAAVAPANAYANFFAFDATQRGGVRVAVKRVDGEDRADLLVGSGDGANTRIRLYRGTAIGPDPNRSGDPVASQTLDLFGAPALATGVFVG